MRKIKIFLFLCGLFLCGLMILSLATAAIETLGTFKQGDVVQLRQICADCTFNNVTSVHYPNSTIAISDKIMTKTGSFFNYSFDKTNVSGRYVVNGIGDLGGTNTVWAYDFYINPSGVEATLQRTNATSRSIYFLFGIAIIFFIGAYFLQIAPPYRLSLFLIGAIFILICVNVIFVSLTDEIVNPKLESLFSTITVISFYMFWFIAALIFVLWIFTFFVTVFDKKKLKQEQSFGGIYGKYD